MINKVYFHIIIIITIISLLLYLIGLICVVWLGGHLVAGHHGHRTGQGRAAQLGPAPDARALPHSQEQSAAVDGQLHQILQRVRRGLSQQGS